MGLSEGLQKILANDYEQTTLKLLREYFDAEGEWGQWLYETILAARLEVMAELQRGGFTFAHPNDWEAIQTNFRNSC